MRKLIGLLHISLDASVGESGDMGWIKLSKDVLALGACEIEQADTGLYGPATFQMMEAYWPHVLDQLEPNDPFVEHTRSHALWYKKAKKIVFSTKLKNLENKNARLISSNVAAEVQNLKKEAGKNLMIFGSPRLIQSFLKEGMIDELFLTMNPIILGKGLYPFAGMPKEIVMHMIKTKVFENGVIGAHYACERQK